MISHLFKEIHVETSNTFSRPDQVDHTVDQRKNNPIPWILKPPIWATKIHRSNAKTVGFRLVFEKAEACRVFETIHWPFV
jgi:hypothetical protein